MSQKWVKQWNVDSWAGKDPYKVSISVDGQWGCSCPQWKFRRIECKHIREIKAQENWNEGDPGAALKLTALRVQRLKAKGKSDEEIEKDLSNTFLKPFPGIEK
jgi:hypothetical protein